MKKVVAIILALAMVLSLCMINSFADSDIKHVSRDQLTLVEDGNADVGSFGNNPNPSTLDLTSHVGKTLRIWGWLGTVSAIKGFGYTINGGELVTGDFAVEAEPGVVNAAAGAGATESSRFAILVPITEGSYTIEAYVLMDSGNEAFWTVQVNPKDAFVEKKITNGNESIGVWIQKENNTASVKFTTAGSFTSLWINYWASCVGTTTGPEADWTVDLYKFEYNTENTLAGTPLKTMNMHSIGDGNPDFKFDFGEEIPAGTYIVKFTVTNPDYEQDFSGTMKKPYLVLPKIENPDGAKFEYSGDAFNLHFMAENIDGDFFLNNPEETAVPAQEEGPRDFSSDSGDKLSYDQILVNGNQIANGNDAVIAAKALVDGSDGTITTIALHGWYGNANSKIVSYGYRIDGGEPVYGDWAVAAGDDVIAAGGESRYTVPVDVSGLKDGATHKIEVVVKLQNGDVVVLNRNDNGTKDREVYVNYKAPQGEEQQTTEPETNTQTGDMTVAMFAVIAVLAMGAAVVFMKKKVF